MNIPNAMSCLRLVVLPVFVWLYFFPPDGNGVWALIVLVISGLTDLFDGYLARRLNQVTRLGIVLDPIADKLTQATVTCCIAIRYPEYFVIFVLTVIKELAMLIGAVKIKKSGREIEPAKWFGKVYTTLFYCTMALLLLFNDLSDTARIILFYLVLAMLIFAFVMYVPVFIKIMRADKQDTDRPDYNNEK